MKEITLDEDYGSAKKGSIFIQGLHGVPTYYDDGTTKPEYWYWEKGSKKEQNRFLPARCLIKATPTNNTNVK